MYTDVSNIVAKRDVVCMAVGGRRRGVSRPGTRGARQRVRSPVFGPAQHDNVSYMAESYMEFI